MRPLNLQDQIATKEIADIHRKLDEVVASARVKEENHQYVEALCLYHEAQHLSYYVGEGLKVTIMNEDVDRDNWHKLNNKIEMLEIKIRF